MRAFFLSTILIMLTFLNSLQSDGPMVLLSQVSDLSKRFFRMVDLFLAFQDLDWL
jgi:hypothetical protein